MNKQCRAKRRIEADIKKKEERKEIDAQKEYNLKTIFTMQHFIDCYKPCLKGVSWKYSVQSYKGTAIEKIYESLIALQNGKLPKLRNIKPITIRERGRERIITPTNIRDRHYQKVLCNYCLVDELRRHLIYDNGASLKGKGTAFARQRINEHLNQAIREFGGDFYALVFDYQKFFDSIPHDTCQRILERYFADEDLIRVVMDVIKAPYKPRLSKQPEELEKLNNNESKGMCLGSQVSQIMALIIPNAVDHYIKDVKGMKYYVRYMDDGVVLGKTKEELQELLAEIRNVVALLGLVLNENKTHIVKMTKGFTFMKVKYFVDKRGRLTKTLDHAGAVRMRRKLRKFKTMVDNGKMTLSDVDASLQSWLEHAKIAKSYRVVRSMLKLYNKLFLNR